MTVNAVRARLFASFKNPIDPTLLTLGLLDLTCARDVSLSPEIVKRCEKVGLSPFLDRRLKPVRLLDRNHRAII
jgi:hypothetical protein